MVNAQSMRSSHAATRVVLFGDVAIERSGETAVVPGTGRRTVLALLASRCPGTVPLDALHDALWPAGEPASAAKVIQTYVSQLRRLAGDAPGPDGAWQLLVTRGPGYALALDERHVDVRAFERSAMELGDPVPAHDLDMARATLDSWRGDPYPGIESDFAIDEVRRLEAVRADLEVRTLVGAAAAGRWEEVVPALTLHAQRDPTDERVAAAAIEGLWRQGRRAEALRLHARVREALVDELGIDPGPELSALLARILRDDQQVVAPGAATSEDLLPDTASGVGTTVLPWEGTRLIGRETELASIDALLDRERLVVLTGAGGAGKTRIALRAAHERAAMGSVRWVGLQGFHAPEAIVSHCLRATGGADPFDQDPLTALTTRLGAAETLLVLDNCEHLADAAADLITTLLRSCPRLTVLATSRVALHVAGEQRWKVPPLSLPEEPTPAAVEASAAGTLFVERASHADPGFELDGPAAQHVARICARLDGMPLAIELAAARAAALSPSGIDEGLSARFALLTSGGPSEDPRHRTLRATTEWSYDLLDVPHQMLLERLSVFAGAFRLSDAAEVCADAELPGPEVPGLLADLVDRSVLERARSGRYRLLETVREFARERLGDRAPAVEQRHARWVCALFEDVGRNLVDDTPRWYRTLDAAMLDARVAFDRAARTGDADTVLRLSAAASWALINTGRFQLQVEWSRAAVAIAESGSSAEIRGAALRMAGAIAGLDGRATEGFALLEQAREELASDGHDEGVLWCDYWRITSLADIGQHEAALEVARDAIERSRGVPAVEAHLQVGLGEVLIAAHVDGGRPWREVEAEAEASQRAAVALAAEHGYEETGARAEMTLALVASLRGRHAEALEACQRALERWRLIGKGARLALAIVVTARVAVRAGEPDLARTLALEGIAACSALGWKGAMGSAYEVLISTDGDRDPEATQALVGALPTVPATHRWRLPCPIDEAVAAAAAALGDASARAARERGSRLSFAAAARTAADLATPADASAGGPGARAAAGWL